MAIGTDDLDVLRNALSLEKSLRDAAGQAWAGGDQHGLFRQAHDASVAAVVAAARSLIAKTGTA
jgi:hypothetical protein